MAAIDNYHKKLVELAGDYTHSTSKNVMGINKDPEKLKKLGVQRVHSGGYVRHKRDDNVSIYLEVLQAEPDSLPFYTITSVQLDLWYEKYKLKDRDKAVARFKELADGASQ